MTDEDAGRPAVAIIGAGPKGVGVLERIGANAPELLGDRRLVVHLIDPHPPGGGRVWRAAQSPLLRMNSMPQDVTMFTDDTVTCAGPIRPGPTLAEWIDLVRTGRITVDLDPALCAELRATTPTSFPTRRLQSAYLGWVFQRVLAELPDTIEVRVHADRAVDLAGPMDGRQSVRLAGRADPLVVDTVVLALGHLEAEPDAVERDLAGFADRHRLRYFPPAYTADLDMSAVEPGETVLLRGFGLACVDVMVLLTEGRGGRFRTGPDGRLHYHPSGAEPLLYVGSRRGVPYHAKPEYALRGAPAGLPKFFGRAEIARLLDRPGPVDFRTDVWPLAAKDIAWGYYTELFTGHPDRVRVEFAEFAERYAEQDWDSPEMRALVEKAVPAQEDRLDLAALDRPLAGARFAGSGELTEYLVAYIEADLARRRDRSYSADLGAFLALLVTFRQVGRVAATGRLDPRSQLSDVDGWWHGFFSYYASGPPGHRLDELLALVRAGLVAFVGPDMWVRADEARARFVAGSPSVPGTVTATALVEARLPAPGVGRSPDPLIRTLRRRGDLAEEALPAQPAGLRTGRIHISATGAHLLDRAGHPHPRRFALGPHTSLRTPGAFTRPRTNAAGFRENDMVARQILQLVNPR